MNVILTVFGLEHQLEKALQEFILQILDMSLHAWMNLISKKMDTF